MDLRCGPKKHAELYPEDGFLEVRCSSIFCGSAAGVVVIHRFSLADGELLETQKFRDPNGKG